MARRLKRTKKNFVTWIQWMLLTNIPASILFSAVIYGIDYHEHSTCPIAVYAIPAVFGMAFGGWLMTTEGSAIGDLFEREEIPSDPD